MGKVFVIWHDYDGIYVEDFRSVEAAEMRLDKLQGYVDSNGKDYGATIEKVIQGEEMKIETIEIAKKVRLKQQ